MPGFSRFARLVDAWLIPLVAAGRGKHKLAQFQIREAHEKAEAERLALYGDLP